MLEGGDVVAENRPAPVRRSVLPAPARVGAGRSRADHRGPASRPVWPLRAYGQSTSLETMRDGDRGDAATTTRHATMSRTHDQSARTSHRLGTDSVRSLNLSAGEGTDADQ